MNCDGVDALLDVDGLAMGVLSNAGKKMAVLKGGLKKSKGGVRIAEDEVKFRIEYLGCWCPSLLD
jgi:hypothetical protein